MRTLLLLLLLREHPRRYRWCAVGRSAVSRLRVLLYYYYSATLRIACAMGIRCVKPPAHVCLYKCPIWRVRQAQPPGWRTGSGSVEPRPRADSLCELACCTSLCEGQRVWGKV